MPGQCLFCHSGSRSGGDGKSPGNRTCGSGRGLLILGYSGVLFSYQPQGFFGQSIGGQAELLKQDFIGGGASEAIDSNDFSPVANVTMPPLGDPGLDGHPGRRFR